MNLKSTNTTPPVSVVLRFNVIAGLTAAAIVLPKAMAYATVAGLPVSVGLYTAFIPMILYALLGSSQVLSVSSTTTLGILAGAQLSSVVPSGDPALLVTALATLTVLVGVLLILASLLKLGYVIAYFGGGGYYLADIAGHDTFIAPLTCPAGGYRRCDFCFVVLGVECSRCCDSWLNSPRITCTNVT